MTSLLHFAGLIGLVSLHLALPASAIQIIWGSSRAATNLQSTGQPMTDKTPFFFQLGSFEPGFVPNASNTDHWLKAWSPAQSTPYNASTGFFSSSFNYDAHKVPFLTTNQAYIWGFNLRAKEEGGTTGEWILLSHPSWKWPAVTTGPVAFPYQWTVSVASEAIVGQINDPQQRFHMMTQSVALPGGGSSPEDWRNRYFASQAETIRGWAADPDGDGRDNLLELALGTNPTLPEAAAQPKFEIVPGSRGVYAQLSLHRSDIVPGVKLQAEISEDLRSWLPGGAGVVVEEGQDYFRVREISPISATRQRFLRVVASF